MPTKREELKHSIPVIEPLGSRMAVSISPASLLGDDAELTVRGKVASGELPSQLCGKIWGVITHGFEHTNPKYPDRGSSIRWHGEIGYQKADGTIGEASAAYLPLTVGRELEGGGCPVIREPGQRPPQFLASFSVECWCERVSRAVAPLGFGYATYNRMGRRHNINSLAPPEVQAYLPPASSAPPLLGYDPETGEIDEEDKPAEAAE